MSHVLMSMTRRMEELSIVRTGLLELTLQRVQQEVEGVAQLVEDRAVCRQVNACLRLAHLCSVLNRTELLRIQSSCLHKQMLHRSQIK